MPCEQVESKKPPIPIKSIPRMQHENENAFWIFTRSHSDLLTFQPWSGTKARSEQPVNNRTGSTVATSPWFVSWADRTTSDDVGKYPSVAYSPIDGLPHISYYDAETGNLMLASPDLDGGGNCGMDGNWGAGWWMTAARVAVSRPTRWEPTVPSPSGRVPPRQGFGNW